MVDVIKRDGRREPFSAKKVRNSIESAAKEAKVPEQRIKQVIADASREPLDLAKGKTPIETRTIRDRVLARLDTIEPTVSKAWRNFDGRRK